MDNVHLVINLRHKDQFIRTCWFNRTLKVQDIKEFTKYKLYNHVEIPIENDQEMMEFCHSHQEYYKLYFTRIITIGGKEFLEATCPSQEDQERILQNDIRRKWINMIN
ncbi:hypothetical protein RclHR1_01410013 [Rhizophagus clarus]|uniref:Uncharacterized protein n=1 Tax=Rhizophagus clarus TaxID=94130 RepID=A0A2Z6QBR3_9GLOM|nr:hypothetical protein RclHR1_01410013 [Rhizophagus clarus]GES74708.1 hypothetical protein RCL_e1749_RclHR1_01410013 [Rhizophagus clarus]